MKWFLGLSSFFIVCAYAQPKFLIIYNEYSEPIEFISARLKSTRIPERKSTHDPELYEIFSWDVPLKKLKPARKPGGIVFPMIKTPRNSFVLALNLDKDQPGLTVLSAAPTYEQAEVLAFLSDDLPRWELYVSHDGDFIVHNLPGH